MFRRRGTSTGNPFTSGFGPGTENAMYCSQHEGKGENGGDGPESFFQEFCFLMTEFTQYTFSLSAITLFTITLCYYIMRLLHVVYGIFFRI